MDSVLADTLKVNFNAATPVDDINATLDAIDATGSLKGGEC